MPVYTGQGTVDIVVVSVTATHRILMAPIGAQLLDGLLVIVLVFLAAVDFLKVKMVARLTH